MQFHEKFYCDFCFEQIESEAECPYCHLTQETYHIEPGLLTPGTILAGKYVLGRLLGQGGFGATYLAFEAAEGRKVAIKEYYPSGLAHRDHKAHDVEVLQGEKKELFELGSEKFYKEAKTIARFSGSPNIVSVYGFFHENNTAYYSMEYLQGEDLKHYIQTLKNKRMSEKKAVRLMTEVCNALMLLHSAGMIHRDIAPDNIFICDDGKVKLIDFGAVKQYIGEKTESVSLVFKSGYSPMEQYQKEGKLGHWTDIYSLGATIYYALTGTSPMDAISRNENGCQDIIFDQRLQISDGLRAIINHCMKLRTADRYQGVYDIISDLSKLESADSILEDSDSAEKQPAPPIEHPNASSAVSEKPKFYQRKNLMIALGIAVVLVAGGTFGTIKLLQPKAVEPVAKEFISPYLTIDGAPVALRYPVGEVNGVYVVSVKEFAEVMKYSVETKLPEMMIHINDTVYVIKEGSREIRSGDKQVATFSEAPFLDKDELIAPLRELAELMGSSVSYDSVDNKLNILKKPDTPTKEQEEAKKKKEEEEKKKQEDEKKKKEEEEKKKQEDEKKKKEEEEKKKQEEKNTEQQQQEEQQQSEQQQWSPTEQPQQPEPKPEPEPPVEYVVPQDPAPFEPEHEIQNNGGGTAPEVNADW